MALDKNGSQLKGAAPVTHKIFTEDGGLANHDKKVRQDYGNYMRSSLIVPAVVHLVVGIASIVITKISEKRSK